MPRKPQDVTDAELAVLQLLWDRGTSTVRDITDTLYPSGPASDVATVQKLLHRLEQKAWVKRNRDCWPHLFEAAMRREELIDRRLQKTADTLCDGSLEPLLTHLVRSRLDAGERQKLRQLLDELDQARKAKRQ